jgi:nitrate/TMAO reductase-like tetraheme cytochrome c subunit
MSISNHWRSTMMANAAKDPLWLAKVSSEVARNPKLQQVIETKCATCHMPMAWTQASANGQNQSIFEDGFLDPGAKLHAAAMDGVSCSLCHQIMDKGLGTQESFSGKFRIDTEKSAPDRKIFGPYREPVAGPMQTSIGYTPVYGPQTNDSALCATCHTLFTPYVDAAGNVAGEFPEQTPYLEWKHSDFGVSAEERYDIGENQGSGRICQECHMPHSKAGKVKIAKWAPPSVKEKDHFSQHHFVGGNVFMLNVLQDNSTELGLTASTAKLEDTKQRTLRQLQNDSADLSIVDAQVHGKELVATVQVENLVGHKFPTGFPSRNLWLHLTVFDANDQVVFESGKPRADGRISGNNADEQEKSFEPHYDVINAPAQVQIYETIMANTDGAVTYTLLRAAGYLKDNRLLPKGFDKNTAGAEIGVYGVAKGDGNFVGGADQVTYKVALGNHTGPFRVGVALLYNTVSYNFMRDLRQDAELPLVRRFERYYSAADKTPVTVAAIQTEVR